MEMAPKFLDMRVWSKTQFAVPCLMQGLCQSLVDDDDVDDVVDVDDDVDDDDHLSLKYYCYYPVAVNSQFASCASGFWFSKSS